MKYNRYIFLALLLVLLVYMFLSFSMPVHGAWYEPKPPLESGGDAVMGLYPVLQHYRINEQVLDGFQDRGILKYGRSNPMLPTSVMIAKVVFPDKDSGDGKSGVKDEPGDGVGEKPRPSVPGSQPGDQPDGGSDKWFLVPVPFDRELANRFYSEGVLPVDLEYFRVSSGFGVRRDPFDSQEQVVHLGIDIAMSDEDGVSLIDGRPVCAVLPGTVYLVSLDSYSDSGYGNLVVVSHGSFVTYYAHLKDVLVTSGQEVAVGDILGHVGSTGRSTGPHLHFELRVDGTPTDPFPYLFEVLRRTLDS